MLPHSLEALEQGGTAPRALQTLTNIVQDAFHLCCLMEQLLLRTHTQGEVYQEGVFGFISVHVLEDTKEEFWGPILVTSGLSMKSVTFL